MAPDQRFANNTYEVEIDKTEFVEFEKGGCDSVVTRELNGCSVAIIVSSRGPIVAHVPPLPTKHELMSLPPVAVNWNLKGLLNAIDPHTGDHHMEKMMEEFTSLYEQHLDSFPAETLAIMISALYMGEVALPDQRDIMKRAFDKMGISPISAFYSVMKPGDYPQNPKKGLVFIDGGGDSPVVHVEDQAIRL
ncbi:MAG: hypothetical protein M1840_001470 [Geoglossum simile]|nr:MAG: hypothetical protein M1840_001470 [Geoglossum simile]